MSQTFENRVQFLARVEPLFAPSIVQRIEAAYDYAKNYHRAQTRKSGDRYFEHCRHTALILIDTIGCAEPDLICAALLHDTLEDTRLTAAHIEQFFGERVCQIVVRVTKKPKVGYVERLLKFGEWPELLVKLCDRLHNLRTMGEGTTAEWRQKQCLETKEKYLVLFERLHAAAPVRYSSAIASARAEMCHLIQ